MMESTWAAQIAQAASSLSIVLRRSPFVFGWQMCIRDSVKNGLVYSQVVEHLGRCDLLQRESAVTAQVSASRNG